MFVSLLLPLACLDAALLLACTLLRVRLAVARLPVALLSATVLCPFSYVSVRRTGCLVVLLRLLPAGWCSAVSCGAVAAVDADRLAARGIKSAWRVLVERKYKSFVYRSRQCGLEFACMNNQTKDVSVVLRSVHAMPVQRQ
jgi:hypothetical protein